MIEEIKKEIELYIIKNHLDRYDELVDNIWEILDKYKKQENKQLKELTDEYEKEHSTIFREWLNVISEHRNYKNAWNELKEDCREVEKANDYILYERLQQLEKKYNIGRE